MDLAVQGFILLYFSTQSWFCPDKKPADKFHLPPSYQVLSELPDITSAVLDSKVSGNIDDFDVADKIFQIQLPSAILFYDSQSVSEIVYEKSLSDSLWDNNQPWKAYYCCTLIQTA